LILTSLAILWNSAPEAATTGPEGFTLLLGYGTLTYSKVSGIIRPFRWTQQNELAPNRLLAPVCYNISPGFGFGSLLQGDNQGAQVGILADVTAFASVGILSLAALSGHIPLSQAAGVICLGAYTFARVYGIVRAIRFHNHDRTVS